MTMKNLGWIKVHRKLVQKGYYRRSPYVHLWLHLLLKANHEGAEFMWNGRLTTLCPGQFITGLDTLARETGIPRSTVNRILKCFQNETQIGQQMTNKFRLITVLNWTEYQRDPRDNETPAERGENPPETPPEANNNGNKADNVNNSSILPPADPVKKGGTNKIFDVFYRVNPLLNYANKTQRSAAERLIATLGEERAIQSAEAAVTVFGKEFAPTITTPLELEYKLSQLMSYYLRQNKGTILDLDKL